MQNEIQPLSADHAAVLKHIDIYQSIISRMASNSSTCKHWCIVLISAFLAFVIKDGKLAQAWIAAVPISIFWFLDAYYLALEKQFRDAFKHATEKIRTNTFYQSDLFIVQSDGKIPAHIRTALLSLSVWPVYLGLLLLIAFAMRG